jgi:hypothetical protein
MSSENVTREMIYSLDPPISELVCMECQEYFILVVAWIPGKREIVWENWRTIAGTPSEKSFTH